MLPRNLQISLIRSGLRLNNIVRYSTGSTPSDASVLQQLNAGQIDKVEPDQLSAPILKQYFLTNHDTSKALKVLSKCNNVLIPNKIAMIPFRRAVYNCEWDNAFKIMDMTVGSKAFLDDWKKKATKFSLYWSAGTTSVLVAVESLLQSGLVGTWTSTGSIHAMVFTYLSTLTIYSLLAFAGRASNSGAVVKWAPGTFITYWYQHAAEMKMASLLAEMNMAVPKNHGACSPDVRKELARREMIPVEPEQEVLLKEYWARGGEGFEWVEPDQDPAEIEWRHSIERLNIGASQESWTDNVVRSLPHAGRESLRPAKE